LNFLDPKDFELNKWTGIKTLFKSSDGIIYGELNVKRVGLNQFVIESNEYGFELHRGSLKMSVKDGFKLMRRNALTNIGGFLAGPGKPFNINFKGVNTVEN